VHRRTLLATAALASATGCSSLLGGDRDPNRLDLTVQNDRDQPLTATVTVVGPDDTVYLKETEQFDPGVARAFVERVGTTGRHEVTVEGEGFGGSQAWNAEQCSLYDARIRLTPDSVESSGECVQSR